MRTADLVRRHLMAAIAIFFAIAVSSPLPISAQSPKSPATAPPAEPLTESERQKIVAEITPLKERLALLRNDKNVLPDHWADAQIFIKGLIWALDFGPINDAKSREQVQRALGRARERIDALASGRHRWTEQRGRLIRGFISAVDGSTQPYGLVVPANYDPAKPIRLDVVLHGSRADRATGTAELNFISGFDVGENQPAREADYIEVHPLGRLGENAYRFEGETDVDEAIEAVCRNYSIDRMRIVLRGSSLGGVGAWMVGLKRPDRWVAVGPTAGPVDTIVFAGAPRSHFIKLAPLTPWQKLLLHEVDAIDYAANGSMTPVVCLMGDQDAYFPSHLQIEQAFAQEGVPLVALVDRGAGHGVTPKAFQEQLRLLGEHAAKGKDPAPHHIRFVTWTLKFSRCDWIEVLGLAQHYERAEIVADLAMDGSVKVAEPRNITRFSIAAPALQSSSATLTIGGTNVAVPPPKSSEPRTVVVERSSGKWQCLGNVSEVALRGKRPGLQGPIDDAFATPFLCVRGTGQPLNPAVHAWAIANLNRFADEWRRHYRGYLPLKDDTDLTPHDVQRCNLILFGDPGSNHWIRDCLPKLSGVQWTRDEIQLGKQRYSATETGLQLIYPNPLPGGEGRYAVFNSGHTYHDFELQLSYMVFPRLGDWAVLRVGDNSRSQLVSEVAENVVTSGFFDENWSAPIFLRED